MKLQASSAEQRVDGLAPAVVGDIKRAALGRVRMVSRDAHRFVHRGVHIGERHRILDRKHRVTLSGFAIGEAALEAAAEKQHAVAATEVAVEAEHLLVFDDQLLSRAGFGRAVRLAPRRRIVRDGAPKLGHHHDQGLVEHPALVQLADEGGQRAVDLLFHGGHAVAPEVVHIEALERPPPIPVSWT